LIALQGLASMPLAGYRILIVEDEALIAVDLSHVLEDLHAIVVGSVNKVGDARKLVSEAKIDCAVLDVQLGGESVAALIPELDARHIPRVFMTAFPERLLPKAWTVWPVLEKPVVRGDLLRAIERVIEKRTAGHD
jgi:two-component SAPR family response regulator